MIIDTHQKNIKNLLKRIWTDNSVPKDINYDGSSIYLVRNGVQI